MNDQDVFATLRARVIGVLRDLHPDLPTDALARVQMDPPRDPAHGDMATNAALVVGKAAGQPPPRLAASLAARLLALPEVLEAAPAGPGFVNLRLHDVVWRAQLPIILRAGTAYGDGTPAVPQRLCVEYVSANPTGPMTVGHCRGAVVGDALAALLAKAGHAVTREYYVNDAGNQVAALAWAAYWRYLQALGWTGTVESFDAITPGGLQYRGDYMIPVGTALAATHGDALAPGAQPAPPELWLDTVRETAMALMMDQIREDLAAMGIRHDVFVSERAVIAAGKLEAAEALLDARGLVYRGVLEAPRGKTPDDWEPREQTLFRATHFGDEVDRALRKSDGSGTYFAHDIANHLHKIERGFDRLIHVWGADHAGYVRRMTAAVAALSDGRVPIEVVVTQIVRVVRAGAVVRMSKRAGTYVALRDLIEEVGADAVRFTMLTRKADAQMDFDLDAVVAQTRENPVFYVQYAHARCRSVLRQAGDPAPGSLAEAALDVLADPHELALLRRLAAWPRTVAAAAEAREPHRIAFFLHDLAGDFHLLWNRGREAATLRFIQPEAPEATRARLALVAGTAAVLRSGLAVMGVTPVEEMR